MRTDTCRGAFASHLGRALGYTFAFLSLAGLAAVDSASSGLDFGAPRDPARSITIPLEPAPVEPPPGDIINLASQPIKGNDNTPQRVAEELLDPRVFHVIGTSSGISDRDLYKLQRVRSRDSKSIVLLDEGAPHEASKALESAVRNYIRQRANGHSRDFLIGVLTNKPEPPTIADPYLLALRKRVPILAAAPVRKLDTGSYTNRAGTRSYAGTLFVVTNGVPFATNYVEHFRQDEVVKLANYVVVDGDVAGLYQVRFDPQHSGPFIICTRADAKDYDGKYTDVISEVEDEVKAQMNREGTAGRRRSKGRFEVLKKERLKTRGLEWRTFGELNPRDPRASDFIAY